MWMPCDLVFSYKNVSSHLLNGACSFSCLKKSSSLKFQALSAFKNGHDYELKDFFSTAWHMLSHHFNFNACNHMHLLFHTPLLTHASTSWSPRILEQMHTHSHDCLPLSTQIASSFFFILPFFCHFPSLWSRWLVFCFLCWNFVLAHCRMLFGTTSLFMAGVRTPANPPNAHVNVDNEMIMVDQN